MTSLRSTYRPDVDGMRAIAVLAVLFHHINPDFIPNGFVGVDVFFVISGFVVTLSILNTQTGHVWNDLVSFWRRRWFRIIPALLAMLIFSSLFFAMIFPPHPYESFNGTLRTALAASIGLSNFYLLKQSVDYFASDQSTNLFLHTWSLGVEEQFYIIFSILVIAVPGLLASAKHQKKVRFIVLGVFFVISFLLLVRLSTIQETTAYYMLFTRFWEMAAGSMLALGRDRIAKWSLPRSIATLAQVVSAALLIYAMFLYPTDQAFFYPIMVAVFATVILILTGIFNYTAASLPVTSVLGYSPFVFIGLLSYSIYLWHWPILLGLRYTLGLHSFETILLALLLIFLFAFVSYKYIETPCRRSSVSLFLVSIGYVAAYLVLIAVVFIPQWEREIIYLGRDQDWTNDWRTNHDFSYTHNGKITPRKCSVSGGEIPDSIPLYCQSNVTIQETDIPKDDSIRKLILVGDSYSYANWAMAAYAYFKGNFNFTAYGHDGCNPFGGLYNARNSCLEYLNKLPSLLANELNENDIVFVSYSIPIAEQKEHVEAKALISQIARVVRSRKAHLIVQAVLPKFTRHTYLCSPESFRLDYTGCNVDRQQFVNDRQYMMNWLKDALAADKDVAFLWDPVGILCQDQCVQFDSKGYPLFRDGGHLSYYGAKQLGPEFYEFINGL